jgi:hypothetical protein
MIQNPKKEVSKKEAITKINPDLAIAGSTSLLTTGAGIALISLGGPITAMVGGIVLGAGISGSVNATQ